MDSKARYQRDLIREIDKYNNVIAQKEGQIKKLDDELVEYKSNKHFLDILAMQAG